MTITPDDKDWTWVLRERCSECGIEAGAIDPATVGGLTRRCARDWSEVLTTSTAVTERPTPDVWSPLEYGCHVRDVFTLFRERLALMLTQDDPLFANWDQDATAIEDRYGEQDPADVAAAVLVEGRALADAFDRVGDDQWDRTGRRSDGAGFTVATFAQYFIHDPLHHLHDVRRG